MLKQLLKRDRLNGGFLKDLVVLFRTALVKALPGEALSALGNDPMVEAVVAGEGSLVGALNGGRDDEQPW